MKQKTKNKDDWTGLAIPAGIFTGMGFGFLYNQLIAGIFLGMGLGFLLMLILKALHNK